MGIKKFKDQIDLRGQLEEITMMDLRNSPGEILDQTKCGKVWILSRNGIKVGAIIPLPEIGKPQVEFNFKVNEQGEVLLTV